MTIISDFLIFNTKNKAIISLFFYFVFVCAIIINMKTYIYHPDIIVPGDIFAQWSNWPHKTFHNHDYFEILTILSGSLIHICNNTKTVVTEGEVLLIQPAVTHCFSDDNGNKAEHINIAMKPEIFSEACGYLNNDLLNLILLDKNSYFSFKLNVSQFDVISKMLKEAVGIKNYNEKKPLLKTIIIMLLEYFVLTKSKIVYDDHPEWLKNLLMIMKNPETWDMNIKELSSLTYFSHEHLSRLFKKHMGTNLVKYLAQLKMEYASHMLTSTNYPITYIASKVGYNNSSNFTKVFKEFTGFTPREYKAKINN